MALLYCTTSRQWVAYIVLPLPWEGYHNNVIWDCIGTYYLIPDDALVCADGQLTGTFVLDGVGSCAGCFATVTLT